MPNTPNISPEKLNELLNLAGKKMGTDPMKLKNQLEQGAFNDVLKNVSPQQSQNINKVLSDPKALEALLNSPKAKLLLQSLMGGK